MNPLLSIGLCALGVVILFFVCAKNIKKTVRKRDEQWETFWKDEYDASSYIGKNFPEDLLLEPQFSQIPMVSHSICENAYKRLKSFESKPMAYLKSQSNQQLKKQYGVNYLSQLISAEETFFSFIDSLGAYAKILAQNNFIEESNKTLEYALSFGYDKSKLYELLIENYHCIHHTEKLKLLVECITTSSLSSVVKTQLIQRIEQANVE